MPPLAQSVLLALAGALVPVLVASRSAQRLVRAADDPLLPELLLARQRRVSQVTGAALLAIGVFTFGMLPWAVPLTLVGVALAGLPMRRRLFGERVGAWAYLEHALREFVGGAGPWLLVAVTPALVLALPEQARIAGAAALAAAIVAWLWGFARVWLACMVAAPFGRDDVEPLLHDVAARARAPMPRVVRFGTPGIHLVNAYALPGLSVSTVAFSRRLLDTFPPEEIAAVFAHEIAHLEHADARRMWVARAAAVLLAALSAGLPLVAPAWLALVFPAAFTVAFMLRAARSREHETASDRRAVELLRGDGDVLARALVRLHLAARMPRRVDREFEKRATHPSLARRVQAIHEAAAALRASARAATRAAGTAAPRALAHTPAHTFVAAASLAPPASSAMPAPVEPLEAARAAMFAEPPSLTRRLAAAITLPVMLRSPGERVVVALAADRVYWFDDVPDDVRLEVDALREAAGSYRALRYADVTELRVAANDDARWLLVRERSGEPRRIALHPGDVALAQRALDMVDGQLGHAVPEHSTAVARLVALALALVAPLGPGVGVATILAAALVLWCPARPLLAALGAAAVAEAVVSWHTDVASAPNTGVVLVGQLLLGLIALGIGARAAAAAAATARRGRTIAAMAILGVIAAGVTTSLGFLLGELPAGEWLDMLAGTSLTTVTVGLLAATAAALVSRRARRMPLVWTVAGALLVAVASAFGGAAIVGARVDGAVAWRDVTATVAARRPVPKGSMRVLTSPSGRRWAVQRAVVRGTPVAGALSDGWDWDLGSFAEGRTRTVRALALAFLDDTRVVVLARRGDSLEVRLEPAFAGEDPLPRRPAGLPALLNPVLRVDRASGTWHVAGRPRPMVTGRRPADGAVDGTFEDEDDAPAAALLEVALAADAFSRPDTMVVAAGRVGSDRAAVRRWVLPALASVALPLADGGVLYYEPPRYDDASPWRMLIGAMPRGTLWRLGADGARTRLESADPVQCGSAGSRGEALCVERGMRRLRGLVVDGRGRVTGRVTLRSGWVSVARATGAHLAVAECDRQDVALLDAARRGGTRAMLGERACVIDATPTPHGFVGIRTSGDAMELVSWRMPR